MVSEHVLARRIRNGTVTLLDVAQVHNMERFLRAAPKPPPSLNGPGGTHEPEPRVFEVPFDLYWWAMPRDVLDGYPKLSVLRWPGHE